MWWALIWAFIIGSAAASDHSGGSAGFLTFCVIWYFAAKSDDVIKVADNMIAGLRNKVSELESQQYQPPKKDYDLY